MDRWEKSRKASREFLFPCLRPRLYFRPRGGGSLYIVALQHHPAETPSQRQQGKTFSTYPIFPRTRHLHTCMYGLSVYLLVWIWWCCDEGFELCTCLFVLFLNRHTIVGRWWCFHSMPIVCRWSGGADVSQGAWQGSWWEAECSHTRVHPIPRDKGHSGLNFIQRGSCFSGWRVMFSPSPKGGGCFLFL